MAYTPRRVEYDGSLAVPDRFGGLDYDDEDQADELDSMLDDDEEDDDEDEDDEYGIGKPSKLRTKHAPHDQHLRTPKTR